MSISLDGAIAAINQARGRDQILRELVVGSRDQLERARLFAVKQGALCGLLAREGDDFDPTIRDRSVRLTNLSVAGRVVRDQIAYIGPAPGTDPCAEAFPPGDQRDPLVLVPLVMAQRTVCLLAGRPAHGANQAQREALDKLVEATTTALARLIHRKRTGTGEQAVALARAVTPAPRKRQTQELAKQATQNKLAALKARVKARTERQTGEMPAVAPAAEPAVEPAVAPAAEPAVAPAAEPAVASTVAVSAPTAEPAATPGKKGRRKRRRKGRAKSKEQRGAAPAATSAAPAATSAAPAATSAAPAGTSAAPVPGARGVAAVAPAVAPDERRAKATGELPPDQPERRTSQRLPYVVEVTHSSDHNFFVGFMEDISEGGLFVATFSPLVVGERLELAFSVPGLSGTTHVQCEVRWVREFNPLNSDMIPGVGVRFLDLPAGCRDAIHRFIKQRSAIFYEE